ncbi:MAG: acyl-CoA dehydrogenase [Gammaproteobacteria bacterium]|jgi:acyl-CoA dehydrogenase
MATSFWLLLFIATMGSLFYFRISLLPATIIVAIYVLFWQEFAGSPPFIQGIAWIVFLAIAIPLNVKTWRRRLISDRALAMFRKILPTMSQTEREALDAGSVWWDGELFSGKPRWSRLLNTHISHLSEDEQAFIDGPVNELCRMLDDWQITHHDHDLPEQVWQFLKDKGFFAMIIPKRYGGLEFSALAHSTVVMKVAGRSITAAVTIMVPNSLGPAELLLRYGTEEQKDHYLQRLARGIEIPCFALTSPEAGSDAAAMTDTGIVCKGEFNGEQDVLGIRLNWEKRYITLGPIATVLGLAFKLYDPDHLLGDKEELGITCALIPTDTPGVEIGNRHFPLNSAFQNGPNWGKDVFIPIDWIIGGRERAGQGWRMLMECLAAGRSISLPALSTGAGKLVSRLTSAYARVRKQFKTPIGRFEGVEEALARIGGTAYMMDAARTLTASAIDNGESPSVISAIVKYNLTESMRSVVNDAMDIHGGSGICLGPRNVLGRIYQSIPISITVEGANILTRSMIIFGQGAIRCHPHVLKEMEAAHNTDDEQASRDFDDAFFAHVGFTLSNALRSLWLGLTGARLVRSPVSDGSAGYYRQLTRFSSAFAFVSDMAMLTLGGDLKRKEKLSGRLADILSHLYLSSAVLKQYYDQGQHAEDLPLLRWWCEHSLRTMQQSLDRFLLNFPNRPVAWILRRLVFPLGKQFSGPGDVLDQKVTRLMLQHTVARERLTHGMFLPADDQSKTTEPVGRLEYAMECVIAADAAEKKLRAALQTGHVTAYQRAQQIDQALQAALIDEQDAELLRKADQAQREALTVDDFEPAELAQQAQAYRAKEYA